MTIGYDVPLAAPIGSDAPSDTERLKVLKRFDGLLETVSAREEHGTIPVRVSLLREVRALVAAPRAGAGGPSDTERLDWLEAHPLRDDPHDGYAFTTWAAGKGDLPSLSVRDVIDRAMSATRPPHPEQGV